MKNSNKLIESFGNKLTKELKDSIPIASGKSSDSVNIEFTREKDRLTGFKIKGEESVEALRYGRRKTPNGASAGDPTLRTAILGWIKSKGIRPDGNMTLNSLAYLIARKIHKIGFKKNVKVANVFDNIKTKSFRQALQRSEWEGEKDRIIKAFNL